jgi:pilus assembly protein Flp/PilA
MQRLGLKLCFVLQGLVAQEDAQDLVEYTLVIALLACGTAAASQSLSSGISTFFHTVQTTLASS